MIIYIIEIIIAALLIGVILLQNQGSGLSASFGGSGETFRSRRSVERILVYVTVILAVLFILISIFLLLPR